MVGTRKMKKTKSVTIKAAVITSGALILAALIGSLFKPSGKKTPVTTGNQHESPVIVMEEEGDITINYYVQETQTTKAIDALEQKISDVNASIGLTREEIRLLSLSLKDLNQRTSGIEKLPDGRTKIGRIVTGEPTIVLEEHNAANINFKNGNYSVALEHSQKAIGALEATEHFSGMQTGKISDENVGKIYFLGALIAQKRSESELAHKWAKKSVEKQKTPKSQALLATTLFNLGQRVEALNVLNKSLEAFPNNVTLLNYKSRIQSVIRDPEKQ